MSLFSVQGLALRFGGVHAIRDVSFTVEQGEIFAIIGPNGAGKTSVFNVITRVFDPTSGSVNASCRSSVVPRRLPVGVRTRIAHHGTVVVVEDAEPQGRWRQWMADRAESPKHSASRSSLSTQSALPSQR